MVDAQARAFSSPPNPKLPKAIDQMSAARSEAPKPTQEEYDRVRLERQAKWNETDAGKAAMAAASAAQAPLGAVEATDGEEVAPSEAPVDHIEIDLPSGLVVEYGPRPGANLMWDIARLLGSESNNSMLSGMTRTALCIRSINGIPVAKPGNEIEIKKILNQLDERDSDLLYAMHQQTWPPLLMSQLPTVKKIFR